MNSLVNDLEQNSKSNFILKIKNDFLFGIRKMFTTFDFLTNFETISDLQNHSHSHNFETICFYFITNFEQFLDLLTNVKHFFLIFRTMLIFFLIFRTILIVFFNFRPWWDNFEDFLVYGLVILGLIVAPTAIVNGEFLSILILNSFC